MIDETGNKYTIASVPEGGSSTTRNGEDALNSYVVPSRRAIQYEFDKGPFGRAHYINYSQGLENLSVVCGNLSFNILCDLEGLINLKYVNSPKSILRKPKLILNKLKQNLIACFHKESMQPENPEKVK